VTDEGVRTGHPVVKGRGTRRPRGALRRRRPEHDDGLGRGSPRAGRRCDWRRPLLCWRHGVDDFAITCVGPSLWISAPTLTGTAGSSRRSPPVSPDSFRWLEPR